MSCVVCQSTDRTAMEADFQARRFKHFREHWGLHHMILIQHMQRCGPATLLPEQSHTVSTTDTPPILPVADTSPLGRLLSAQSYEVHTSRPFTRFKQAWQDAKDDVSEQRRMVMWLNDQLQADDMGLP